MNYNTISPVSDLCPFVKCYWTLEAPQEENPERQRIVPDGCMEMIFNCGDPYKQYADDGSYVIQPRSFVFGQITQPLEIEATGLTNIFAIRFHPEGFVPFAAIPVNQMENRAVPLPELFDNEGAELEGLILNAVTNEDRVRLIEAFLMNRLIRPESIDRIVKSSVETMLHLNGQLSVDELSEHLNINRRQLERKFSSVIGLSPKKLSRIIRLQATLKMIANKEFTSLTSVAYEGYYYDQAHFIKDFKEFTGISPKKFYASSLKMSSLFLETE